MNISIEDFNYIVFILAYDLLHDELANSKNNECDNLYELCIILTMCFKQSVLYKDYNKDLYSACQCWIEDNKKSIYDFIENYNYTNFDKKEEIFINV